MMKIVVILVNYNDETQKQYIPLLSDNGITASLAHSMPEALIMLVEGEYSGVVINGDNFEYLPLLKVMRKITTAPIGVSVSRYNQEENYTAIKNGDFKGTMLSLFPAQKSLTLQPQWAGPC